jgi:hypothetical protein
LGHACLAMEGAAWMDPVFCVGTSLDVFGGGGGGLPCKSPHVVCCVFRTGVCTQAYVCEVGYFVEGGAASGGPPAPRLHPGGVAEERGGSDNEDDDIDDDEMFVSSSASGRLQAVFYVLRMMSRVRACANLLICHRVWVWCRACGGWLWRQSGCGALLNFSAWACVLTQMASGPSAASSAVLCSVTDGMMSAVEPLFPKDKAARCLQVLAS